MIISERISEQMNIETNKDTWVWGSSVAVEGTLDSEKRVSGQHPASPRKKSIDVYSGSLLLFLLSLLL